MNEPKKIIFDDKVREAIKRGVDTVCNAVKVTLGPSGKYVLYPAEYGPGVNTNDGVTVAKQIVLEDEFENLAAQKVIEAASKTNDVSGDGTTTACILTQALINQGLKNIAAGADSVQIIKGIKQATNNIVKKLKEMSQKISTKKEMEQVATISAGDIDIGKLVAEAINKVGKDGVVTIEEGSTEKTEIEMTEGLQFDRGYLAPLFITDEKRMEAVLEDCYILLIDQKIQSVQELMTIMAEVAKSNKPVLIICNGIDNETLGTLVINKLRGTLKSVVVYTPGWGDRRKEQLKDIAILTDGTVFCNETGNRLDKITLDEKGYIRELGRAKKVIVSKDHTTIVSGVGSKKELAKRIEDIKGQISICKSEYDTDKLRERLAKLSGGIAVINVGGVTESEMRAKKFKIEDALHATQAALNEGIVEGGGCAYLRLNLVYASNDIGAQIVYNSIQEPTKQIAENAGKNGEVIVSEIIRQGKGYDALNDKYVDMKKAGIIDPTLTIRTALENATSIACLLLTTNCLIGKIKEEKK